MSSLFEEFESVSKEAWLAKIAADAKGRPISDFEWLINEDFIQSPFVHRSDKTSYASPIDRNVNANSWRIGERILVKDIDRANNQIIAALENGVGVLFILLEDGLSRSDFEKIFKGVNFTYIKTYFEVSNEILGKALVESLVKFCQSNGQDLAAVEGGIVNIDQPCFRSKLLIRDFGSILSKFSFASVATDRLFGYQETIIHEVASLLLALVDLLASEDQPEWIFVNINIGKSYLLNIAKVRAIHLLVNNLLKTYDSNAKLIFNAQVSEQRINQEENQNLVQFTTQAMSAVIGGVDCLTLPASDVLGKGGESDFRKRLSRNVQSMMQVESFMDKVVDPAAGSYYIEQLTDQIVERSWTYIQNNS